MSVWDIDFYNIIDFYNNSGWNGQCVQESTITYVIGVFLCIGGILSYLPQYIALINSKEEPVISELSLLLLNIGSASLGNNILIRYSEKK